MRVLACVVNWNTAHDLPGVVASLRAQRHIAEIVVVDNHSHDNSVAIARGLDGVNVIANDRNRGFAGAANQGVARAQELGVDAFLVCNPDVRLDPGYLSHAVAALAADAQRASVAGKLWRSGTGGPPWILDSTGHLAFRTRLFRNRGEGELDHGQYDAPGEVFGVSGAAALYRLDALRDVALDGEIFDEDLFAFFEDVDLDWRLRRRGWHCWYEPAATGWHERGGSGPRRSAFVEELNWANHLLLMSKHERPGAIGRSLPAVLFTTLLKTLELLATEPAALRKGWTRLLRRRRAMHAKRQQIARSDVVAGSDVAAQWFHAFDYAHWVRLWWRRRRTESALRRSQADA